MQEHSSMQWHCERNNKKVELDERNKEEREALDALVALLQENPDFDSDTESSIPSKTGSRPSNLPIRSLKMPPTLQAQLDSLVFGTG